MADPGMAHEVVQEVQEDDEAIPISIRPNDKKAKKKEEDDEPGFFGTLFGLTPSKDAAGEGGARPAASDAAVAMFSAKVASVPSSNT